MPLWKQKISILYYRPNIILYTEEKRTKKVNSITKIGKAALTKLFKSSRFCGHKECVTVYFPNNEMPLDTPVCVPEQTVRWGNIDWVSCRSFFIWGIELGLIPLSPRANKDILESIKDVIQRQPDSNLPIPSHIVCFNWIHAEGAEKDKNYAVYRLSSHQENAIKLTCFRVFR